MDTELLLKNRGRTLKSAAAFCCRLCFLNSLLNESGRIFSDVHRPDILQAPRFRNVHVRSLYRSMPVQYLSCKQSLCRYFLSAADSVRHGVFDVCNHLKQCCDFIETFLFCFFGKRWIHICPFKIFSRSSIF